MGRQNASSKIATGFSEVPVDDVTSNVGCNNREITVDKISVLDNLEGNKNHFCPAFTIEEYYEVLQAAVPDYADLAEWSPLAHCQVLSNILKRPVCLFTSLQDLDRGESFIFLPLRHRAKDCYKHPITIAWQGRGKNDELRYVRYLYTFKQACPLLHFHSMNIVEVWVLFLL